MQTLKNCCIVLSFLFLALMPASGQQGSRIKHSSVCLARTHYKEFASSYVAIDAAVFADGMHGVILLDDKCPNLGLILGVALPGADHSVADFDKILWSSGSPGPAGAKITGSFVGRLRRDPKTRRIHYDLLSVENLRVANASDAQPGVPPS
jgi:hypothetical protein